MSIKRIALVVLLLLVMTGLGTSIVQASGLCVHPTGAGKCFSSIQAAVDAADDGDRITVRAGKYVEQVTILDKDVSLIGWPGAVVQSPNGMQDTLSAVAGVEGRPIILAAYAEVTIRNLTIDGNNSADANPFLDGITFVSAGGVIRDNVIKNIGFGAPRAGYQGNGIVVANQMPEHRTVVIADNRIYKFNSVGVTVFAETDPENPAESTLTAHILDNSIVAQGANAEIDQWGIFLGGYSFATPQTSVTGTVKGNYIQDAITVAPYPLPGVGIITQYVHDVLVEDNTIVNTNVGMAANLAFSTQITRNNVAGKESGLGSTGLILSGGDNYVSANRFLKLDLGLLLLVEDPMFGSATNTGLENNRFDLVPLDMMTGSVSAPEMAAKTLTAESVRKFGPR